MTVLLDIAPLIAPASPFTTGAEIYQRFELEPDTLAIAVVDGKGRPVGLVERNAFLVRMAAQYGRALWSGRPISMWMNAQPLVVDGDVTVAEFCGRILEETHRRPAARLHRHLRRPLRRGRHDGGPAAGRRRRRPGLQPPGARGARGEVALPGGDEP